jgi:hypothetical protein
MRDENRRTYSNDWNPDSAVEVCRCLMRQGFLASASKDLGVYKLVKLPYLIGASIWRLKLSLGKAP